MHEPLLRKFREHKALAKKISRALGRGEVSDAARLERNLKPRLTLDHIIKERYPTFTDALRDLDDALSMLFLFASLPSTTTIPPKTIARCQRLCLEFQHYLIVTNSLQKSFLSIKGIYYQATIQGQDILWLAPYKFVQRVTDDIDFRIMGTFVDFYTALLGFVNFRLYTSIGLVYPPKFNAASDEQGGELRAITLEGKMVGNMKTNPADPETMNGGGVVSVDSNPRTGGEGTRTQEALESVVRQIAATEKKHDPSPSEEPKENDNATIDAIDTFIAPISADADVLPQPSLSSGTAATLFSAFTFFLSRETPRQPLEFLLRAFGCNRIGWDVVLGEGAFTTDENDTRITHHVVDRPPLLKQPSPAPDAQMEGEENTGFEMSVQPRGRVPGRMYIQPQWVWDCVNAGKLLPPDLYAPGAELPPHLSPWVKPSKGQYDPTIPLAAQEQEGEAEDQTDDDVHDDDREDKENSQKKINGPSKVSNGDLDSDQESGGMDVARSESSDDEEDDQLNDLAEDSWGGFDEEIAAASDDEDTLHQRELEAEATGVPLSDVSKPPSAAEKRRKAAEKRRQAQSEELERQKMMMSRKKRKSLEKMLYSNAKKEEEAASLRRKRRKIERGAVS